MRSHLECASVSRNELTLADSNKLDNTVHEERTTILCYSQLFHPDFSRDYDLILESLNLVTLYTRQQIDAVFLIVFNGKMHVCPPWVLFVYMYPLYNLQIYPSLPFAKLKYLVLQLGVQRSKYSLSIILFLGVFHAIA